MESEGPEVIVIPAELLDQASPEERDAYFQYLVSEVKRIDEWEPWLKTFFPVFAAKPFSKGHRDFWEWVWKVDAENKPRPFVGVWPRGFAKALAINTPLRTPTGWINMGGVAIGDRLMDEMGNPCVVMDTSPIEIKACYRIHFKGGSYLDASGDHLWTVLDRKTRRVMHSNYGGIVAKWASWSHSDRPRTPCEICGVWKKGRGPNGENWCAMHYARWKRFGDPLSEGVRPGRARKERPLDDSRHKHVFAPLTITTENLLGSYETDGPEHEYAIPVSAPLNLKGSAELPIDPWILGLWLGDGTAANAQITVGMEDFDETVERLRDRWQGECRVYERPTARLVNPIGLNTILRKEGLKGNKHIPDDYLQAEEKVRRDLLAGLLDSDGSAEQGACVFGNTNRMLVTGVHDLAVSLGYRATITEEWAMLYGKDCGPFWKVRIVAHPGELFYLKRKCFSSHAERMELNPRLHYITKIERLPDQQVRCVRVDSPNSLFLAGRDCIPTHNSTSAEMAVAALAARGIRKYGLFISETQDQADDHVANIASMLESSAIELAYPDLGTPAVNKQGQSKGWRRNRIVTASGFILDACGLDSAARGIKFEAQRPDFLCLDDIDSELDGEAMTLKKIKVITQKLLPAGSPNCAILMVQNLVHKNSIFARLCSKGLEDEPDPADFLRNRIVSGPIPAVEGLEVEEREVEQEDGSTIVKWVITGGTATWPEGFPLESCEALINEFGLSAFMAECQHITEAPDGEIFSHLKYVHIDFDNLPRLKRVVVWVDPAVSSNDTSDCMGIQVDGLGVDGKIYRLWSWEQRSTPYEAMKRAIRKGLEYNADVIGIETNQGDQLWRVVYDQAMEDVRSEVARNGGDFFRKMPRYKEKKATKDLGSKITRAERMLVDYERHIFVHVNGTHDTLERSLRRFPKVKPFDLCDAAVWSWSELAGPLHRRKMKLSSSARKALATGMGVTGAPQRPIGL